jgi:hypothetical protein
MDIDRTLLARLPRLAAQHRAGDLSPAEYAACYVLHWQFARHPRRPALRRSRFDPKPDCGAWLAQLAESSSTVRTAMLIDLLESYDLREVRRRVNLALIGWLRGAWDLTLCERVPSVRDVLRMQARGTRPVTAIADYPRLLDPVLEKPNAFAFICHDLEHAWQFFHDPEQCVSQRRFAQQLEQAIDQGVFAAYLVEPTFAEKFDYLAADMNTHVGHSLQYLRAILLEFHLRAEGKERRDRLSPPSLDKVNRCIARFIEALGLVDNQGRPISLAVTGDAAY